VVRAEASRLPLLIRHESSPPLTPQSRFENVARGRQVGDKANYDNSPHKDMKVEWDSG
jgi:hypothetical protein